MKLKLWHVLFCLPLALCCGCCDGHIYNRMERISGEEGWCDTIWFSPVLDDLQGHYTINFYAQFSPDLGEDDTALMQVGLLFTAPDSLQYSDRVELPLSLTENGYVAEYKNGTVSFRWPYRKNISVKCAGGWQIALYPIEKGNSVYKNVRAVALSIEKE